MAGLHTTATGPERGRLGFADVATTQFRFLLNDGFRQVEVNDTFARYESPRRFVRVFHGRASYELGVEIGRWIEVEDGVAEQVFPLREVIEMECDPAEIGFMGTTAATPQLVSKFLEQLAAWTRDYAHELLADGDGAFALLSARHTARFTAEQEELRASRLRARADQAWRKLDFGTVANAYSEIDTELSTVDLKASERGRLNYALSQIEKA
jgi:hypothetical protein